MASNNNNSYSSKSEGYGTSAHYLGEAGKRYFDQYSVSADLDGRLNSKKFSSYIEPTDTVLDFGCAAGDLLKQIVCARRVGVEVNPIAMERTLDKGIECYASLSETDNHAFDVVLSNHALEHVPQPLEALRQMREKLKEDGVLLLCIPLDDWRNATTFHANDLNHHLYAWTPLTIGNLLSEAGFHVSTDDIHVLAHAWPPKYAPLSSALPDSIFNAMCKIWSVLRRRRQIFALARP